MKKCSLSFLFLLLPAISFAQAGLSLDVGYNDGIHSGLENSPYIFDSEVRPVLSFGLFNGHFGEEGRDSRWGLRYARQLVRTIPEMGPNYATKWRSQIFQLETERLVHDGSRLQVILGMGVGFVSRSDANENDDWNYCDTPFCNLPEFNWLVTPKARLMVPVLAGLALSAEVRANIHTSAAAETFPYKSGLAFMVGLEWRTGPGPGDPVRKPEPEPDGDPLH